MSVETRHGLGWKKQKPDSRDYKFRLAKPPVTLPSNIDLSPLCPPVYDQGELGSCTANAVAAAVQFDRMKQGLALALSWSDVQEMWSSFVQWFSVHHRPKPSPSPSPVKTNWIPSRLFLYYNTRAMEGTVNTDAGAELRDTVKSMIQNGDCPEPVWPYIIDRFTQHPPQQAYTEAYDCQAVQYSTVDQSLEGMKTALASGYPFVIGFTVYNSFFLTGKDGNAFLPRGWPNPSEPIAGGHAVLTVGYDDTSQRFLVRNSWGTGWGKQGYFTIPYEYWTSNQASDLWVIQTVEG